MKLKALAGWHWEVLCVLVYLALTGSQLFVRPITGLADNGDFPKVLGPRNICDPNHEKDAFAYVYPSYTIDFECRWDSHILSSETLFVKAIKRAALWDGRRSFRITGAGKAHLPVMLAALMILLWALHDAAPVLRFGLPPLMMLIFSDVAYVSYLNSFYMDAACMVFLLLTVALAAAWVLRPRTWVAIAFGVAGVLTALAKTQHAVTGFLFAALAAFFAVQAFGQGSPFKRQGWCWGASAAAIGLAAAVSLHAAPPDIHADPMYNLIFFRLLPESPNPMETLANLGLPQTYLAYSGTHAYNEKSPMANGAWRDEFGRQISLTRLAAFYCQNPLLLLRLWNRGLTEQAFLIRPGFANYQREDGFPPWTVAHRFDWWSNLRTSLLRYHPFHVVVFYLVMSTGAMLCFFLRPWAARWPLYPLVMVLAASGALEFVLSVSLDVIETSRHLFIFHVLTETLIVCAFAGILSGVSGTLKRSRACGNVRLRARLADELQKNPAR